MEVHAHSHTARKKWTHYIWEFLMLFLAVFCGFLAENEREHYIEHSREKQYIRSLVSDLTTDIDNIKTANTRFEKITLSCDTLMENYDVFTQGHSTLTTRCFRYILSGYPDFVYTDRTIQQLKNSGGLRLIRKMEASDSIVSYDANIRDLLIEESAVTIFYDKIHEITNRLFNFRKLDRMQSTADTSGSGSGNVSHWLINDPRETEHLYNIIRAYKTTINSYIRYRTRVVAKAERLVLLLKKKYHL